MDPKLEWFIDWSGRGMPVEYNGKTMFIHRAGTLMADIAKREGLIILGDNPASPKTNAVGMTTTNIIQAKITEVTIA